MSVSAKQQKSWINRTPSSKKLLRDDNLLQRKLLTIGIDFIQYSEREVNHHCLFCTFAKAKYSTRTHQLCIICVIYAITDLTSEKYNLSLSAK